MSINPNLINASNWLQSTLALSGNPRGALQILEQMTDRDPLYRPGFSNAVVMHLNFGQHEKTQALIERYRGFDPSDAALLRSEGMQQAFLGNAADSFRLAEQAFRLEPTNRVTQNQFTFGLLETQQTERIAEEGSDFLKVAALDRLGRGDEAVELALQRAREGNLGALFRLYNRVDRSQELIDYLEERWPALDAFAADYPHNVFGYALMAEITLAYSRTGNTERFDEALLLLENAMSSLSGQGVNNFFYEVENAKYLALAGEYDEAISQLETAIDRGYQDYAPIAAHTPIFVPLQDDPRFIAAEAVMVENINADRESLGLEPIDPLSQRL